MTTFIPELGAVSGRELQLRRVLADLGDGACVRTCLHDGEGAFFLEHDQHGWLALTICSARYAEVCRGQLVEPAARAALLRHLHEQTGLLGGALPVLVVLWSCSTGEAALLAQEWRDEGRRDEEWRHEEWGGEEPGAGAQVTLWSREQFVPGAIAALRALMRPLSAQQTLAVRRRYFPESEIVGLRVGRRNFHRDNHATLTGIFLDREQEWAAKLDLTVPDAHAALTRDLSVRLLNGVAGSGKTLIALQRALFLAQTRPAQQVLLLIHNAPVVADLIERMQRSGRVLPDNLAIRTFAKWANEQWYACFGRFPQMPKQHELVRMVGLLHAQAPVARLTDTQLLDEINFLNDAIIDTQAQYLAADRAGRGFALRESERSQVWALAMQLHAQLRTRRLQLWSAIASDLCRAPRPRSGALLDHILVDEAQFMAPAALQAIQRALRPGGSLFLCADPRQGFLKSRLSWKSVGLEVVGRTKKLRRSYRSTRALLHAANQLLARAVDEDPEDDLAPDFAGMEAGVAPLLITVATPLDAVDRVANEIAALAAQSGFPLSTILVIHGERVPKALLYNRLCQRIGAANIWWLNRDRVPPRQNGSGGEHVRLASIDSATGLEGTFVFLLGVEALLAPAEPDPERGAEARARKLYMAMTRSCYRLSVVTTQALPEEQVAGVFERRA